MIRRSQFQRLTDRPYNWRATRIPERPYRHAYHLTLVDKIFLCHKPNPTTGEPARVLCTFAEALERIRAIDNLTRGIPKILYLVGWQFDGHDSKYPSWSIVNDRLKRPQDDTALASLLWLLREGRRYHTTVSVHINMNDAYENSPDWPEYARAGLIEGKGGVWGGEQCHLISHAREWASGLARRRIDHLVAILSLAEAGTVHVDAFGPVGADRPGERAAMRAIVRYWRDRGIDVTIEDIPEADYDDGLVGLVPMLWHLHPIDWPAGWGYPDERYMNIPPTLLCGGVDGSERGLLFGTSMHGEPLPTSEIESYLGRFCLSTLPWQYLNRRQRVALERGGADAEVRLSGGLVSRIAHGAPLIE